MVIRQRPLNLCSQPLLDPQDLGQLCILQYLPDELKSSLSCLPQIFRYSHLGTQRREDLISFVRPLSTDNRVGETQASSINWDCCWRYRLQANSKLEVDVLPALHHWMLSVLIG